MLNFMLNMCYCSINDYLFLFQIKCAFFPGSFLHRIVKNLLFTQLQKLNIKENICQKNILWKQQERDTRRIYRSGCLGILKNMTVVYTINVWVTFWNDNRLRNRTKMPGHKRELNCWGRSRLSNSRRYRLKLRYLYKHKSKFRYS